MKGNNDEQRGSQKEKINLPWGGQTNGRGMVPLRHMSLSHALCHALVPCEKHKTE